MIRTFIVVVGMTIGCFLYQYTQDVPNYITACERSFFAMIGAISMSIVCKVSGNE